MADFIIVAEFTFVVNKSFLSGSQHPITIPARFYPELKKYAFADVAQANISFRSESVTKGAIRVGWRAGGRYFQITMSKAQAAVGIADLTIGTSLRIRVLKTPHDWLIEIN